MRYGIHPGIVMKEICGEYVLIAVGEAGEECPRIRKLNSTGVYFWEKLEKGMSFEEMIADALSEYDSDAEQIRIGLTLFIKSLEEQHFLNRIEETKQA